MTADSNALPAIFFNVNSPRGVVFSTPGSGFLVSGNAGLATPPLFGFGNDLQTFSAQRLFTAVNSTTTDVHFFLPGTTTAATTGAFGVVFVDVEVSRLTRFQFFDGNDDLNYSHDAAVSGNQGFSFLGATVSSAAIARVRITSGLTVGVADKLPGAYEMLRTIALDHEILRVFQQLGVLDTALPHCEPFTPSEFLARSVS